MENFYTIKTFIGEGFSGNTEDSNPIEIEYAPLDDAIIIRECLEEDSEIWLNAECLNDLIEQLKEFSEVIKNSKVRENN